MPARRAQSRGGTGRSKRRRRACRGRYGGPMTADKAFPLSKARECGSWEGDGVDLDSGARLLHRLTSYVPDREWDAPVDDPRVRHDIVPNDPQTLPPPRKEYPDDLPVLALPRDLPAPGVRATAVLAGVAAEPRPLDAAQLSRVLFLGAGVVRSADRNGRKVL